MKVDDSNRAAVRGRRILIYTILIILVLSYASAKRQQKAAKAAPVKPAATEQPVTPKAPQDGMVLSEEDMWSLVLINENYTIPEDASVELAQIPGTEEYVDARIAGPLQEMADAAAQEGLELTVCSGYRTKEKQEALFQNKVQGYLDEGYPEEEVYDKAKHTVSIPEAGEHRMGLAVDIFSPQYPYLEAGFADTPEGQWLRAHSGEYGFILRYDQGKEEITGIEYEPWHFRYVGVKAARYMTEKGMCLEEFYLDQSLYG